MVAEKQIVANRVAGPPRTRPAAQAAALTPAEVIAILRRHFWLMVGATVLGLIVGGVTWFLLLTFFPKYTARTFLRILPPVEKDPTVITTPLVHKDVHYGYRASIAALINQQSSLQELIDIPEVQDTKWFKRFAEFDEQGEIINKGRCILKAFRDLEKHFGAFPERDREFVSVSMTCGDAEEAAKILNEMVEWFVASRARTTKDEIGAKLASLGDERRRVKRELDAAEASMDDVRRRWGIADIGDPQRQFFPHTTTLKLNRLDADLDTVTLQINQTRAAIGELEELAAGPIRVQIERQIEGDPIMVSLAQQLALQQSEANPRVDKQDTRGTTSQKNRDCRNDQTGIASKCPEPARGFGRTAQGLTRDASTGRSQTERA
ncbi:MAG: GumC domain-containing protein [Planctomycetota bacterium]|jgi:capsular polysaccharide biosynthesis protein